MLRIQFRSGLHESSCCGQVVLNKEAEHFIKLHAPKQSNFMVAITTAFAGYVQLHADVLITDAVVGVIQILYPHGHLHRDLYRI